MKQCEMAGWGLYPVIQGRKDRARHLDELRDFGREKAPLLPQGNCRSYGDACLFSRVVSTLDLKHLLDFDPERGVLRAQAGITLEEIIRFALPHGFFPPVTPGTKFPTLGGCISADVHGKNHHIDGSIGNFVEELEMILADGSFVRCSRRQNTDLFWATLGGMGLTGFIYAATFQLKKVPSAYIALRSIKTANLRETFQVFAETQNDYLYSVAWIDCLASGTGLGRGIVMLGNHAPAAAHDPSTDFKMHSTRQRDIPFDFPDLALNPRSMRTFNTFYYHRQLRRSIDTTVHYDPFFYPLDAIGRWNRIYGRRGFLQYQFAIPFADGLEVMENILERIAARGTGSFLAVLKAFGPQEGILSFPIPGYTLALDFPLRDDNIIPFLRDLNKIVLRAGGRVYLAKDAILEREDFEAMYPRLEEFKEIKRRHDPQNHFRSHQSERLGIS
jgi:decaprenylphospho-beta-D-ribofuranose 2-oxidase